MGGDNRMKLAQREQRAPSGAPSGAPSAIEQEEFILLMSMALDGLLDEREKQRLEGLAERHPALAAQWASWQRMDQELHAAEHMAPPPDFVRNVEAALLKQEGRRRVVWGAAFGVLAALLWIGLLAGTLALGAYALFNGSAALSALLHNAAYTATWIRDAWQTLWGATAALLGTQQARLFALSYALVTAALLLGWVYFLRRSTSGVGSGNSA